MPPVSTPMTLPGPNCGCVTAILTLKSALFSPGFGKPGKGMILLAQFFAARGDGANLQVALEAALRARLAVPLRLGCQALGAAQAGQGGRRAIEQARRQIRQKPRRGSIWRRRRCKTRGGRRN